MRRYVRQVLQIADLEAFSTFVHLAAGRTGTEVNLSGLGADAGVRHNTARSWLSVLETSFLITRIPAWRRNLRKQQIKAPKLHFLDSGLVCFLLGIRTSETYDGLTTSFTRRQATGRSSYASSTAGITTRTGMPSMCCRGGRSPIRTGSRAEAQGGSSARPGPVVGAYPSPSPYPRRIFVIPSSWPATRNTTRPVSSFRAQREPWSLPSSWSRCSARSS